MTTELNTGFILTEKLTARGHNGGGDDGGERVPLSLVLHVIADYIEQHLGFADELCSQGFTFQLDPLKLDLGKLDPRVARLPRLAVTIHPLTRN